MHLGKEYIFRGKDKKTGEWVCGSLLEFHGFQIFDLTLKAWVPVNGDTIGQYTGVCDDNGKMIFEYDWVRDPKNIDRTGIVVFLDGTYYVRLNEEDLLSFEYIHTIWSGMIVSDDSIYGNGD